MRERTDKQRIGNGDGVQDAEGGDIDHLYCAVAIAHPDLLVGYNNQAIRSR